MWEVGEDLIAFDHWANTVVSLQVLEKREQRSTFERFGLWILPPLALVLVGLTVSVPAAVGFAVLLASVYFGAQLWNRGAARRMAKRLRDLPAASEPFTFRADADGTHGHSASSSEQRAWSRYSSVRRYDELVVLTQDGGAELMLPITGMVSGGETDAAIAAISKWIEAAGRSESRLSEAS